MKHGWIMAITVFVLTILWSPTTAKSDIVLQPGPGEGKDIWTTSVYSYAPGGGGPGGGLDNEWLQVGGWGDLYYTLIEFDLTGLPPIALSARIDLFVGQSKGYGTTGVYLDRITEFWNWRTQGTGSDRERLWWADRPSATQWIPGSLPAPIVGQWYSIDITDLYNAWKAGTYPNYGVQLRPVSNSNRWNEFYSSDYLGDPSLRPKLVIQVPSEDCTSVTWPVDNFDESKITTHYRGSYGPPCKDNSMNHNIPGAGRHPGIDYGVGFGTAVKAIADGIIDLDVPPKNLAGNNPKKENKNGGWGGLVIITHECLGGVYSIYAHLSNYSPEIWKQKNAGNTKIAVKKGDIIGYSGGGIDPSTKKISPWAGSSTGNHLHFQIDKLGNSVIPWSTSPFPTWVKNTTPFKWYWNSHCNIPYTANIPDDWDIYNANDEDGGPYYSVANRNAKDKKGKIIYPKDAAGYYKSMGGQVLDHTYDPIEFISSGGTLW